MIIILSWIASIGSIVGNIGVVKKQLWGMVVWAAATALWIVYAIITETYSQLIMFVVYEILNLYGIYEWSKKKGEIK